MTPSNNAVPNVQTYFCSVCGARNYYGHVCGGSSNYCIHCGRVKHGLAPCNPPAGATNEKPD